MNPFVPAPGRRRKDRAKAACKLPARPSIGRPGMAPHPGISSAAAIRRTGPGPARRAAMALIACSWLLSGATAAIAAGDAPPAAGAALSSGAALAGRLLGLDEAIALARGDQPAIAAYEREAQASEQAAVAARSLPDPQVSVGVQNFPVTGMDAFNPVRDEMTMYTIGVMREQVRRSRREAEAARLAAEAAVSRFEGSAQQRKIQRDVMLAWLEAVEASARQRLLAQVIADLKTGRQVIEAGIPTGSSTPALELQAQAEIALAESQLADARAAEERARGELGRWIGAASERPLPDRLPGLSPPPSVEPNFTTHPEVLAATAQEQAQRRGADVARSERKPSLSWQAMVGIRPSYGQMASVQVSIPLQINRRNLQDRRIAEAEARADAARLRAEDRRRELGGEYRSAIARYRGAEARIALLRDRAIPSLEASFKAAEARYAGGQGTLEMPLNIVRRYVETNIQLVEQEGARARAAAELIYLMGEPGQ
jgi:cobalt-zinc-cadmium efflux system outer membrane protein